MYIDARSLEDETTLEGDVCVVGAGPAGISLALELSAAGLQVLLLEAGGLSQPHDALAAQRTGVISGYPYFPLEDSRATGFGGSARHIKGSLRGRPFRSLTLAGREDIPHYAAWPVSRAALDSYYERAHVLCGYGVYDYSATRWTTVDRPELPFIGGDLRTVIYRLGDPSLWERRQVEVTTAPDITLVCHAAVSEVVTDRDGTGVSSLEIRMPGGGRHWAVAERYVLAGGGIENARLLLLSKAAHPDGLGNEHDLVGRFFMEHLHVHAGRIEVRDPDVLRAAGLYRNHPVEDGSGIGGMIGLTEQALRREGILTTDFYVSPASRARAAPATRSLLTLIDGWERRPRLPQGGAHLRNVVRDLGSIVRVGRDTLGGVPSGEPEVLLLRAMAEQAPQRGSRVLLSSRLDSLGLPLPDLRWQLGDADWRSIRRTHELLDRQLRRSGAGRLEDALGDTAPRPLAEGGYHHMGTTRMAHQPQEGVVGPHGRVHGVENLWIAGSSVFPTGDCANPTLTIVAMSLRLADHLAGRAEPDSD